MQLFRPCSTLAGRRQFNSQKHGTLVMTRYKADTRRRLFHARPYLDWNIHRLYHRSRSTRRLMYVRYGSKADMCSALGDVCFAPIADMPGWRVKRRGRLAAASAKSSDAASVPNLWFEPQAPCPCRPEPYPCRYSQQGQGPVRQSRLQPEIFS